MSNMILPNLVRFSQVCGGQIVARLNESGRKTKTGKANGQTLRGMPNFVLETTNGDKFTVAGVVCQMSGWNEVHYLHPVVDGERRDDGSVVGAFNADGSFDPTNKYGVIPFDWKGEEGTDDRCDLMREFVRAVATLADASSARHWEETAKVSAPRKTNGLPVNALAALGF